MTSPKDWVKNTVSSHYSWFINRCTCRYVCVSIVGPIGFIGLIVPHIVKHYVGQNYSVLIPLTFIIGADLLLLSDVLSRLITFPFESPVGIVTSFVGAIYFLLFTLKGVKRID